MSKALNIGISGKDNKRLFIILYDLFFKQVKPDLAKADNLDILEDFKDLSEGLPRYKSDLFLSWNDAGNLSIIKNDIVLFSLKSFDLNPKTVLSLIEMLPFEIASFETLYEDWYNPFDPYEAPSFGNGHIPHGWACAFKGEGFNRLVSRRWLDFGPWKQHFGNEDTQLIQFHELGISSDEALNQAKKGHTQMGISSDGGFLQDNYVYRHDNEGLFNETEGTLKIIVHGKDISNQQLLDACALKHDKKTASKPFIRNVTYVFMDEKQAEKHLHNIWLRGLECRAIRHGREIVLTDDYTPLPEGLAW